MVSIIKDSTAWYSATFILDQTCCLVKMFKYSVITTNVVVMQMLLTIQKLHTFIQHRNITR